MAGSIGQSKAKYQETLVSPNSCSHVVRKSTEQVQYVQGSFLGKAGAIVFATFCPSMRLTLSPVQWAQGNLLLRR